MADITMPARKGTIKLSLEKKQYGNTKKSEVKKPRKKEKINGFVKEHKVANAIWFLFLVNNSFALISIYPLLPCNCIGIRKVTLNDPF